MRKKLISLLLLCTMAITLISCGNNDSKSDLSSSEEKELLKNMDYGASDIDDFMNNYLTLGKYTGLSYEITQEMWDETIADETQSYEIVKRAAKDTDQVTFNIIGYINGKKVKDLVLKDQEVIIGQKSDGVFKTVPDLVKGKSAGDLIKNVKDIDANEISDGGIDYSGKKVTFDIKVVSVAKLEVEKITDRWVKENYYDDYEWKTTKDFYSGMKDLLRDEVIADLWQQIIDGTTIKKYPDDAYLRIKDEVDMDNNYSADEWGMKLDEYYDTFAITQEDLEKQYEDELASEMISWAIAIKEGMTDITDDEMEENWNSMYEELGYSSVEEMKADRDEREIIRAIILDRASQFVYDNAKITESYKIKY